MPLTTFAASVAVAISLMLITVLLSSASLALERDENTFGRLVRGPITVSGLLIEKIVLAVCCAFVVGLLMLFGMSLFVSLEWARFAAWLIALAIAALAFAAFGATIGALAREVSTASLLAFTLLLPIAFLALVPSGVIASGLYDLTRVISALFPFKATVNAMNSALYGNGTLWQPLAHLLALAVAWAAGRALGAASLRLNWQRWHFPQHACEGCGKQAACADWCARRICRPGTSFIPCSWFTAPTAASPSNRCPASSACRSHISPPRRRRSPSWGSRPCCCSAFPSHKDEAASGAYDDEGVAQLAIQAIKKEVPELLVITDVCLCEYMSHGHCGVVRADGQVDNDTTLELLAKTSVSHAEAGADAVAPSDMMDGRVAAIRSQLDSEGFNELPIISYSAKFASAFYGPVPRGSGVDTRVRRSPRLPDGPGQSARGGARGDHRRRGGRRHRDGQAGAAVSRRDRAGARGGADPDSRLQRVGRVRGAQGGRQQRAGSTSARRSSKR